MAQGIMRLVGELLDKSTPEFKSTLEGWLGQGKEYARIWDKSGAYTLTLDHPDFWQDKQDVRYDLLIATRRDGYGNTTYVVSVLKGLGDDGRWHVAKDYLSEAKGSVRIE